MSALPPIAIATATGRSVAKCQQETSSPLLQSDRDNLSRAAIGDAEVPLPQGDDAMKLPRRTFLHLAAGTAALPIASPVAVLGQGTTIPTGTIRIVERTHYYAKPGLASEVLDQRRKASAVRLSIGLPVGEIFVKHPGGDGSEPDVAWQCTFADAAARDEDLAARAASAEFESVRVGMRKLYARFERQVFAIVSL